MLHLADKNVSSLTLGDKFREIREYKNISQAALSSILGRSVSAISRFERGQGDLSSEQILEIRKVLDVEDAPIFDDEVIAFKKQLYLWRHLIKDKRIDEALRNQQKLSVIEKLPYEKDLNLIFKLFGIRLVMAQRKIEEAKEMMDDLEVQVKNASNEVKYHYQYNIGALLIYQRNFEDALTHFLIAYDLKASILEPDPAIYFNLAFCYSRLGMYVRTVTTLREAYSLFEYSKTNMLGAFVDNMMAANYIYIGHISKAQELLENSLSEARANDNKLYISYALHNFGCASFALGEHDKAIEYFNQSLAYCEGDDDEYLKTLYYKVRCMIANKNPEAKALIQKGISMSKDSEHHQILFSSLSHITTLKEPSSKQYIDEITIPHLLSRYEHCDALYFCRLLEKAYTKNGVKSKKALEAKATAANIYEKIMSGGGATL